MSQSNFVLENILRLNKIYLENILKLNRLSLFYSYYVPMLQIREGNTGIFLNTYS